VTFAGHAAAVRTVDLIEARDRPALEELVARDPIINAVVAARLAAYRSFDPARMGGVMVGTWSGPHGPDALSGAVFNGGNLVPVAGTPDDWTALAEYVAGRPRVCTSLVGPEPAVAALWTVLEPHWGPARAVRERQRLLVLNRSQDVGVAADPRVRLMHPADLDRYLPAAAAMFEEELEISPFAGRSGGSYRRRVESLLAAGRCFGIVDGDGTMAFKADIGALTAATCQVQGVWVRPDLRGRGVGAAALATVFTHALRLAPSVSLYVNDFNRPARRMYAKLGMQELAQLRTVLL
jgi:uncharacterized protein